MLFTLIVIVVILRNNTQYKVFVMTSKVYCTKPYSCYFKEPFLVELSYRLECLAKFEKERF